MISSARENRGVRMHRKHSRVEPARGYGAKAAWRLSGQDTSVATPLANPGKIMPTEAREKRGAAQR